MDTTNKYFTNFKRGIILLIIYIALGTVLSILEQYNSFNVNLFNSLDSVVRLGRTFTMLAMLAITGYLGYIGYTYYSSRFFTVSNISVLDAFMNGFVGMAFVYDKLKDAKGVKNIEIDSKNRSLLVETENVNYSVIVRDYFGKIDGKLDYDSWYIVSRKSRKYNQVTYKKKVRIDNPYKENAKSIERLKLSRNKDYENLVVITSFGKFDMHSDKIVTLYELIEIIDQEMTFE